MKHDSSTIFQEPATLETCRYLDNCANQATHTILMVWQYSDRALKVLDLPICDECRELYDAKEYGPGNRMWYFNKIRIEHYMQDFLPKGPCYPKPLWDRYFEARSKIGYCIRDNNDFQVSVYNICFESFYKSILQMEKKCRPISWQDFCDNYRPDYSNRCLVRNKPYKPDIYV